MLTLCIDTAYKYLSLALIRDDQLLYGIDEECFKHQSEMVFVKMQELFENAGIRPNDIDSICISDGPGSYTGVRIAMTIGKVIAAVNKIDLYTISTLQLYANGEKDTMVILDARAKRVYVGLYDGIDQVIKDQVCELDKIDLGGHNLYGDLYLFEKVQVLYPYNLLHKTSVHFCPIHWQKHICHRHNALLYESHQYPQINL